eukprot:11208747-Lingulodinium_polyedra.AAC.1
MSKLVKKVETLSKKDTMKKTTETFTRGQLEQQHGIAEANAFIAKGKYKRGYDNDGDEVFIKVSKKITNETERAQHMSMERRPA